MDDIRTVGRIPNLVSYDLYHLVSIVIVGTETMLMLLLMITLVEYTCRPVYKVNVLIS